MRKDRTLNARQKEVLKAAVQDYILTAVPVASKRLVERYLFDVSPATIRNDLALLEEMGYLMQPHTSAGRTPTDEGYRYYVDSLSETYTLTPEEEMSVRKFYATLHMEIGELMRQTTHLLSTLTNYIAVAFAPTLKQSYFKHLDLILTAPNSALLVLITNTGRIAKGVVDFDFTLSPEALDRVEASLNREFKGLTLKEISEQVEKAKSDILTESWKIKEKVGQEILNCLSLEEKERIFLGGTSSILSYPEFENLEKVAALLEALEKGYLLLKLLQTAIQVKNVVVKIGSENPKEMREFSVVAKSYCVRGNPLGSIGILGPTRMDYPKAISTVSYVAKNLSEMLEFWYE